LLVISTECTLALTTNQNSTSPYFKTLL